jgi:imidazolonepropionase-like amidohydrolase
MHTHLTFELSSLGYPGLGISTAREALHGAKNARRTLEAGFTTVRNLARETGRRRPAGKPRPAQSFFAAGPNSTEGGRQVSESGCVPAL